MKFPVRNQQGYIALIALIIISAVTLAIALSMSSLGITETDTGLLRQQSAQAEQAAYSCLNEAYIQLMRNGSYAGGTVLDVPPGTCTIVSVSTPVPADRIVTVSADVGGVQRQFIGRVTVSAAGLTLVAWQEAY
ncbi:MAG: hypothetical protein WC544_02615 [Patescibacteria group bacterium]